VTFSGKATFGQARFSGDVRFSKARFSGDVRFNKAVFEDEATFGRAVFGGNAAFDEATFGGGAWFSKATFGGDAWFAGVAFGGNAWFAEVTFEGNAAFDGATFSGDATFDQARFEGDAWFSMARFEQSRQFGPVLADRLGLDDVHFTQPVQIEVSATQLRCRRSRFPGGVQFRLRRARVVLDDTDLAAPSILTGIPRLVSDERPQLLSLRGANVGPPDGPANHAERPCPLGVSGAKVAGECFC
jgi:hypothetical protein